MEEVIMTQILFSRDVLQEMLLEVELKVKILTLVLWRKTRVVQARSTDIINLIQLQEVHLDKMKLA